MRKTTQLLLVLILAFAACLFTGSAWAQYQGDPDDQYQYQHQDRDDYYMTPQMDMARMARLADRIEDWSRHMYQEGQRRLSPDNSGYTLDALYDLQRSAAQFHQDAAQYQSPDEMRYDFQRLAHAYFEAEAQIGNLGYESGDMRQDFAQIRGTMSQLSSYFGGLGNYGRYDNDYDED